MKTQHELEDFKRFSLEGTMLGHTSPWAAPISPDALLGAASEEWATWAKHGPRAYLANLDSWRSAGALSPPKQDDGVEAKNLQIRALQEQVAELKVRVAAAETVSAGDDETVPLGPHERWIESHFDELRKYEGCWVLLDPAKGIVFHTKDQAEFGRYLARFGPEDRGRRMPFHTSMYL